MTALLIDTSQEVTLLALLKEEKIIFWHTPVHGKELSKYLLPALQECIPLKDLDYIAVGSGPGSYTGTRIGVAVAKSLAFAIQIPLLDFSSPLAHAIDAATALPKLIYTKFASKDFHPGGEIHLTY
jgi:tRNA threonylcarbamoyladenosine biosynthesis protein TsaB